MASLTDTTGIEKPDDSKILIRNFLLCCSREDRLGPHDARGDNSVRCKAHIAIVSLRSAGQASHMISAARGMTQIYYTTSCAIAYLAQGKW